MEAWDFLVAGGADDHVGKGEARRQVETERLALLMDRSDGTAIDRQQVRELAAEKLLRLALEIVGELLRNVGQGAFRVSLPEPAAAGIFKLVDKVERLARLGPQRGGRLPLLGTDLAAPPGPHRDPLQHHRLRGGHQPLLHRLPCAQREHRRDRARDRPRAGCRARRMDRGARAPAQSAGVERSEHQPERDVRVDVLLQRDVVDVLRQVARDRVLLVALDVALVDEDARAGRASKRRSAIAIRRRRPTSGSRTGTAASGQSSGRRRRRLRPRATTSSRGPRCRRTTPATGLPCPPAPSSRSCPRASTSRAWRRWATPLSRYPPPVWC